jgi:hypothetical protein
MNDHLQLKFNSQRDAANCELYVPADSTDYITLSYSPVTEPSPGATLAIKNQLTITGKDPAAADKLGKHRAEVWVIPKGSIASNGEPNQRALAKLMIWVLPARQIRVGIYRISDSNSVDTALPPPGSGPFDMPSDAKIIEVLQQIYRQACISVSQDTQNSATVNNVAYDEDLDGRLAYRVQPPSREETILFGPGRFTAKINLIIVGKTARYRRPSRYQANHIQQNFALIFVENFADGSGFYLSDLRYTCAHELGHILNLSTRSAVPSRPPPTEPGERARHDNWPTPFDPYGTQAVMRPGAGVRQWIRHEDWEAANDAAAAYAP